MISSLLILSAMNFGLSSCFDVRAKDLMKNVSANSADEKPVDDDFIRSAANFSVGLFQKTETENRNSLISPTSVMASLTMAANGAARQTLSEMEKVLCGNIPLAELNKYQAYYLRHLPNEKKYKVTRADSIWFRNGLNVKADFLQKNANYFSAAAYQSAFDQQTADDINRWVKKNTGGKIDKMVDSINADTAMYLIDTVTFGAEWKDIYQKDDVKKNEFTAADGTKQSVDFMHSSELLYLDDGQATGFIKPYSGDKYSFVVLLPNETVSAEQYIQQLTGEKLIALLKSAEKTEVEASLPKFSYTYAIHMNDALKAMGMPDAFSDTADFSEIADQTDGNLYIGDVLHKTFITVDERGTKAGAATRTDMLEKCLPEKVVNLNRPFVYAIVENETDLPLFIGTVMSVK